MKTECFMAAWVGWQEKRPAVQFPTVCRGESQLEWVQKAWRNGRWGKIRPVGSMDCPSPTNDIYNIYRAVSVFPAERNLTANTWYGLLHASLENRAGAWLFIMSGRTVIRVRGRRNGCLETKKDHKNTPPILCRSSKYGVVTLQSVLLVVVLWPCIQPRPSKPWQMTSCPIGASRSAGIAVIYVNSTLYSTFSPLFYLIEKWLHGLLHDFGNCCLVVFRIPDFFNNGINLVQPDIVSVAQTRERKRAP